MPNHLQHERWSTTSDMVNSTVDSEGPSEKLAASSKQRVSDGTGRRKSERVSKKQQLQQQQQQGRTNPLLGSSPSISPGRRSTLPGHFESEASLNSRRPSSAHGHARTSAASATSGSFGQTGRANVNDGTDSGSEDECDDVCGNRQSGGHNVPGDNGDDADAIATAAVAVDSSTGASASSLRKSYNGASANSAWSPGPPRPNPLLVNSPRVPKARSVVGKSQSLSHRIEFDLTPDRALDDGSHRRCTSKEPEQEPSAKSKSSSASKRSSGSRSKSSSSARKSIATEQSSSWFEPAAFLESLFEPEQPSQQKRRSRHSSSTGLGRDKPKKKRASSSGGCGNGGGGGGNSNNNRHHHHHHNSNDSNSTNHNDNSNSNSNNNGGGSSSTSATAVDNDNKPADMLSGSTPVLDSVMERFSIGPLRLPDPPVQCPKLKESKKPDNAEERTSTCEEIKNKAPAPQIVGRSTLSPRVLAPWDEQEDEPVQGSHSTQAGESATNNASSSCLQDAHAVHDSSPLLLSTSSSSASSSPACDRSQASFLKTSADGCNEKVDTPPRASRPTTSSLHDHRGLSSEAEIRDPRISSTSMPRTPSFLSEAEAAEQNCNGADAVPESPTVSELKGLQTGSNTPSFASDIQKFSCSKTSMDSFPAPVKLYSEPARETMPCGFLAGELKAPFKSALPRSGLAAGQLPFSVQLARSNELSSGRRGGSLQQAGFQHAGLHNDVRSQLHGQRVLGRGVHADGLALMSWYLPYACIALVHLLIVITVGWLPEAAIFLSPAFILLPALHIMRLVYWRRALHVSVDSYAVADARLQLQSPSALSMGDGIFTAHLGSALQAVTEPPPLLLSASRKCFPATVVTCTIVAIVLLSSVRLVRSLSGVPILESVAAPVCLVFLVTAVCAPTGVPTPEEEVDSRLTEIEAAFNALLDALRPLLGDPCTRLPRQPTMQPIGLVTSGPHPVASQEPVQQMRFSVRLLTADRITLRASLCASSSKLYIRCPLAGFDVIMQCLSTAHATTLGKSAAGSIEIPTATNPHSDGSHGSSFAWAMATAARAGREQWGQRRLDDDLASVSTASTLRRGGANQPDEASLHFAMAMVAGLYMHKNAPLEIFRPGTHGAILPPKGTFDEPSLLLALQGDKVMLCAIAEPPSRPEQVLSSTRARCSSCFHGCRQKPLNPPGPGFKDCFGVLHSAIEIHRLCTSGDQDFEQDAHDGMPITPLTAAMSPSISSPPRRHSNRRPADSFDISSPRSTEASGALSDADELERSPSHAGSVLGPDGGNSQKYIAVVFDSVENRDLCLDVLREKGFIEKDVMIP